MSQPGSRKEPRVDQARELSASGRTCCPAERVRPGRRRVGHRRFRADRTDGATSSRERLEGRRCRTNRLIGDPQQESGWRADVGIPEPGRGCGDRRCASPAERSCAPGATGSRRLGSGGSRSTGGPSRASRASLASGAPNNRRSKHDFCAANGTGRSSPSARDIAPTGLRTNCCPDSGARGDRCRPYGGPGSYGGRIVCADLCATRGACQHPDRARASGLRRPGRGGPR
jgi:hypothetical protein